MELLIGLNPLFGDFDRFQPIFGRYRVVPESWGGGSGLYIFDSSNLRIEVKETSSTPQGVPEGLLGVLVSYDEGSFEETPLNPSGCGIPSSCIAPKGIYRRRLKTEVIRFPKIFPMQAVQDPVLLPSAFHKVKSNLPTMGKFLQVTISRFGKVQEFMVFDLPGGFGMAMAAAAFDLNKGQDRPQGGDNIHFVGTGSPITMENMPSLPLQSFAGHVFPHGCCGLIFEGVG